MSSFMKLVGKINVPCLVELAKDLNPLFDGVPENVTATIIPILVDRKSKSSSNSDVFS